MKKLITLISVLLIIVLVTPAFAKSVEKESAEPVTVEFQATDPIQDRDVQAQGALPIYAVATLQMKKVDNVVRTYASTYTPIQLKISTECWLNALMGGRWAMIDYNIDTQELANASTVNLDDVSYNLNYEYKADSCHTTFQASTGYTGVGWVQDTTL